MKYVMFYESADDVAAKAPAHFPAHLERIRKFHGRGDLVMVGTFEDPQSQGSMGSSPVGRRRRSSSPRIHSS